MNIKPGTNKGCFDRCADQPQNPDKTVNPFESAKTWQSFDASVTSDSVSFIEFSISQHLNKYKLLKINFSFKLKIEFYL